jgi:hypothetical protein
MPKILPENIKKTKTGILKFVIWDLHVTLGNISFPKTGIVK